MGALGTSHSFPIRTTVLKAKKKGVGEWGSGNGGQQCVTMRNQGKRWKSCRIETRNMPVSTLFE